MAGRRSRTSHACRTAADWVAQPAALEESRVTTPITVRQCRRYRSALAARDQAETTCNASAATGSGTAAALRLVKIRRHSRRHAAAGLERASGQAHQGTTADTAAWRLSPIANRYRPAWREPASRCHRDDQKSVNLYQQSKTNLPAPVGRTRKAGRRAVAPRIAVASRRRMSSSPRSPQRATPSVTNPPLIARGVAMRLRGGRCDRPSGMVVEQGQRHAQLDRDSADRRSMRR